MRTFALVSPLPIFAMWYHLNLQEKNLQCKCGRLRQYKLGGECAVGLSAGELNGR